MTRKRQRGELGEALAPAPLSCPGKSHRDQKLRSCLGPSTSRLALRATAAWVPCTSSTSTRAPAGTRWLAQAGSRPSPEKRSGALEPWSVYRARGARRTRDSGRESTALGIGGSSWDFKAAQGLLRTWGTPPVGLCTVSTAAWTGRGHDASNQKEFEFSKADARRQTTHPRNSVCKHKEHHTPGLT